MFELDGPIDLENWVFDCTPYVNYTADQQLRMKQRFLYEMDVNKDYIVKNKEDYFEDYVCKIRGIYYPMELQVAAYWHNHSIYKIKNFYISKSKIDLLRDYVDKYINVEAGCVFMNCVPNKFATINIKDISDDCLFKNDKGELFYKIPVDNKFNYFSSGLIDAKCDCEENHLDIMQRSKGRMRHLQKNYNIRGFNGICC